MPVGVAAGMVVVMVPVPWPSKLAVPMLVGAANEPLALESWAVMTLPGWKLLPCTVKLKLIHVRVLGHLLSQSGLLSDTAVFAVTRDILRWRGGGEDGVDVEKLNDLGEFYKDCLIRPRELKQP